MLTDILHPQLPVQEELYIQDKTLTRLSSLTYVGAALFCCLTVALSGVRIIGAVLILGRVVECGSMAV